jgi:hypothetical protein
LTGWTFLTYHARVLLCVARALLTDLADRAGRIQHRPAKAWPSALDSGQLPAPAWGRA